MRYHSGSVETKALPHRVRRCGRQPKWPPQKRLEEATRGETTAGASKRKGINSRETTAGASKRRPRPTVCAVAAGNLSGPPRRGHEKPEFARNHSGSTETQRHSRGTTAGASKRNGIRAKPQREHRNQGPAPPPRSPLRPATNSFTLNVRTPLCKHCLGKYRHGSKTQFPELIMPRSPFPTEGFRCWLPALFACH